jgi:hypothetical protein
VSRAHRTPALVAADARARGAFGALHARDAWPFNASPGFRGRPLSLAGRRGGGPLGRTPRAAPPAHLAAPPHLAPARAPAASFTRRPIC